MKRIINAIFSIELSTGYLIIILSYIIAQIVHNSISNLIIFILVSIAYTIIYSIYEVKRNKELLNNLDKEYTNYISLVDKYIKDATCKLSTTSLEYKVSNKNDYLITFSENLEMMKDYKDLDNYNFIEASCFMFAFINSKKIIIQKNNTEKNVEIIEKAIKSEIAFNLVLEMLSEITIYSKEELDQFCEMQNIISRKSSDNKVIYIETLNSILLYQDKFNKTCIITFADLLKLFYKYDKFYSPLLTLYNSLYKELYFTNRFIH